EGPVAVRAGQTRGNRVGNVRGQGTGRLLAAFTVGGDEMKKDRLDVIAEPPPLRIDAPQVAPNETKRELLGQLLGRFRVTQGPLRARSRAARRPEAGAAGGTAVTAQQLHLGLTHFFSGTAVRLADERPARRDTAEALVLGERIHAEVPQPAREEIPFDCTPTGRQKNQLSVTAAL